MNEGAAVQLGGKQTLEGEREKKERERESWHDARKELLLQQARAACYST